MNLFRWLFDGKSPFERSRPATKKSAGRQTRKRRPELEILEDRCMPSGTTISGYVFNDLNNNGLMDPGEQGLANASIQLVNSQNQVIATTTTDANGYYDFDHDPTIGTSPVTMTKTLVIPVTATDFSLSGAVSQFDPSLGTLLSVQVTNAGSITSDIRAENTSTSSPSTITATVSGELSLAGPGGLSIMTNVSQNVGSFNAAAFDGTVDFAGASGKDFGNQAASGTQSVTLTGSSMSPFIGTGTVQMTEDGQATSSATGGGNLQVGITSSGQADITVVYQYTPSDALQPGNYTIVKTTTPPGYFDGQVSSNGVVLNNPPGDEVIPVTVTTGNVPNNDFAELQPSSLSGYVYADTSSAGFNDGIKEANELGIAGVSMTLTGTTDAGPISVSAATDSNGYYVFNNLQPGTYTITETHPAGWTDGKDMIGTPGGTTSQDSFSGINLAPDVNGTNNNFGEIVTSSLAGYVYADTSSGGFNDGIKQASEAGIAGVTITLTGSTSAGSVSQTTTTDSNGLYQFTNLAPGTYTITETHPTGWIDGKDTIGTPGGVTSADQFSNISLAAGVNGTNNNFGEIVSGQVGGTVFNDGSATGYDNGVQDPGEAGVAGVQLQLSGTDANGNAVSASTTTNANGQYAFSNLTPGTYTVNITQPSGYLPGKQTVGSLGGQSSSDEISGIVLTGNGAGTNYNFAELQPSSLSGFVYADTSSTGYNDGIKEAGEQGIAGVTVTLTGTNDLGTAVSVTQTTDSTGLYNFTGLRPGTYVITETHPAGWIDGKDTIGTPGGTTGADQFSDIVLPPGVTGANNNFGELQLGQLSGTVFNDDSATGYDNGVQDPGEPGIAGVQLQLTGTDANGNAVSVSATTDANGHYSFANLAPGTYTITETQPSGYLPGKETVGSLGGQSGSDQVAGIDLTAGASGSNYNFAELQPSSLSGYVYADTSSTGYNDGIKEAGEQGIAGVTVTLTGTNDLGTAVSQQTTTDSTGLYSFTGLRPGTYVITETHPAGWIDGKDTIGTPGGTTGADQFSDIVLPPGVTGANNNFGELQLGQLSGTVFNDDSATGYDNGVQDPGEPGLAGVQLQLTGTDASGNAVSVSATTDANGNYSFANLTPGTYTITITQPSGYLAGKETVGSLGGQSGSNQVTGIALTAGATGANYNFAELQPSTISGYVYVDPNDTGIMVPSDQGLPGVTVTLTGTNDLGAAVSVQQTTNASGMYSFTGLRPGTYTITKTPLAGYIDGKTTIGALPGQTATDVISGIAMPPGTNDPNNNFGELTPVVDIDTSPPPGPGLPPNITPGPPVFTPIGAPIVSKGQLVVSAAGASDPASWIATYINSVYTSILGRQVQASELASWLAYVKAGGTSAGLVNSVWNSTEHRQDEVNQMFQSILGVAPDASDLSYYVAEFQSGMSEFQVAAMIAGSAQGTALYPTTAQYVTELYGYAMGRAPTSQELSNWESLPIDRTTMATAIFTSTEALTLVVQQTYQQVLGVQPSTAQVNSAVALIQASPGGFDTFIDDIFTSAQYASYV